MEKLLCMGKTHFLSSSGEGPLFCHILHLSTPTPPHIHYKHTQHIHIHSSYFCFKVILSNLLWVCLTQLWVNCSCGLGWIMPVALSTHPYTPEYLKSLTRRFLMWSPSLVTFLKDPSFQDCLGIRERHLVKWLSLHCLPLPCILEATSYPWRVFKGHILDHSVLRHAFL